MLIASILRIVYMGYDLAQSSRTGVGPRDQPCGTINNQQGTGAAGGVWAILETQLAIVCACPPTLRPILPKKGWFGRLRSPTPTHHSLQRFQDDRPGSVSQNHLLGKPPSIANRSSDPLDVRYEISRPPPSLLKGPQFQSQWPLVDREDQYLPIGLH